MCVFFFFFFKQKTAYEMRISDWSSDVCSSDLIPELIEGIAAIGELGNCDAVLSGYLGSAAQGRAILTGVARIRSEERRVGKECVSTCRSRWSPSHSKKKKEYVIAVDKVKKDRHRLIRIVSVMKVTNDLS